MTNTGIDHETCIATARSSKSRSIKAHYLNLAAYWRGSQSRLAVLAATSTFTTHRQGQLPA